MYHSSFSCDSETGTSPFTCMEKWLHQFTFTVTKWWSPVLNIGSLTPQPTLLTIIPPTTPLNKGKGILIIVENFTDYNYSSALFITTNQVTISSSLRASLCSIKCLILALGINSEEWEEEVEGRRGPSHYWRAD